MKSPVIVNHHRHAQLNKRKVPVMKRIIALVVVLLTAAVMATAQNIEKTNEASAPTAAAIRVLVLDGSTGKPVAGRLVELRSLSHTLPAQTQTLPGRAMGPLIVEGPTDKTGVFVVTTELPERFTVHVDGRYLCARKYAGSAVQYAAIIRDHGVVLPNACNSKAVSVATPGILTLFVRRETVMEYLDW